jgi:hypothetical protein
LVIFQGLTAPLALAEDPGPAPRPTVSGLLQVGYSGGAALQASVVVADFARGFRVPVRLGAAYLGIDPGRPLDARANFINDNTDGTPVESGHVWDVRLDFLVPVRWMDLERAYVVVGPRHARYTGTFEYVGGNEEFDVTAHQWGLGSGLESCFAMSMRTDLVLAAGLDYYFESTLSGHDTSYSPNGETVNGRDGYDYESADAAINQPRVEVRALIGVGHRF